MAKSYKDNPTDKSIKFFYAVFFENISKPEKENMDITVNIDYTSLEDGTNIVDTQTYQGSIEVFRNSIDSSDIIVDDNVIGNNQFSSETPVGEYSNVTISDVIKWSERYPSMTISPADVALLKEFFSYPVNQFVILRRFPTDAVVPHNLFSTSIRPISTLVGYYNLLDEPINISMKEKWDTYSDGFWEVLQDIIGIKFDNMKGSVGTLLGGAGKNPMAQDLMMLIGRELGFLPKDGNNPYGEANLIYEAARRMVDGEEITTGLESGFTYTFETTYEYREINGIDGQELLKRQMNKCMKMGSSQSKFLSTSQGAQITKDIFDAFGAGTLTGFVSRMSKALGEVTDMINNYLTSSLFNSKEDKKNETIKNDIIGVFNELDSVLGSFGKMRHARYKWKITGVLGTMTGMHTAPWHLSFGNPKAPWFTMGNLILDNFEIIPTGELMYDDFPNEWKVRATLKMGRAMGIQEIYKCFNGSKARVPANKTDIDRIIQLTVPEGSTVKMPGNIVIPPPGKKENPDEKININDTDNSPDNLIEQNENITDFANGDADELEEVDENIE